MKRILLILSMLFGYAYGQTCEPEDTVTNNNVTLITYNSARINGTVSAILADSADGLTLRYVRVGFTDTVSSSSAPSTALRNLTGLQPATQYVYYYRTICPVGTANQSVAYYFTTLQSTVTYTPMTAMGYQYKYVKVDSGFIVPRSDTGLNRSPNIGGQIKFRPADSTFYGYNGAVWAPLAIDSSGIIDLLNDKVDSVTVAGDSLFYWKLGVSYGYVFPPTASVDSITRTEGVDSIYFWRSGNVYAVKDSVGSGGGSTNTSVGSGYPVAITGTNNVKELAEGWGVKYDTLVSNEVRARADTAANMLATQTMLAAIGTTDIQEAMVNGSVLNQANDIDAAGFDFRIDDAGELGLAGDSIVLAANAGANHLHIKGDSSSLNKRLSYESNLGGSFTQFTLVDKNYVDSANAISPSLTATRLGYGDGSNLLTGSSTLTFNVGTGIVTAPKLIINSNTDGGGVNDGAVVITRTINENNGSHGFRDKTFITGPLTGTASFDAEATINTTTDTLDHMVSFQARQIVDMGAGSLLNNTWAVLDNTQIISPVTTLNGFESRPYLYAGATVGNRIGFRVREYEGSISLVSNTYGILFDALTKSTGDNYAMYDNGSNKHYLYDVRAGSKIYAGGDVSATAKIHIAASTASANTGQLKFTTGTPPTTPEIGLMNFQNGLWFIDSSNSVRDTIAGRDWVRDNITGGGSGETNTASNLGGGLDNYSTKVGVDLRFNSFNATDFDLASNLISIDAGLKADWQTAYTDRLKWDGGATGLVAATGRTSLGGTTVGQNIFTSANPGAVTFGRANADNTFDWLSASAFRTAIGAGTGNGDLLAANNLSDVASAVTSRNNILPSKTGNTLKVLRVNAGETDYELATISAGGGDMVLADVQSVTGLKTFDKDKLAMKGTSTGITTYSTANTGASNYTFETPAANITAAQLTKLTTSTSANTASTIAERDANNMLALNNIQGTYATTASSAGTLTLTVGSKHTQYITGSTTHTVVTPDATTLPLGWSCRIPNTSSGVVTVNKNGGALHQTVASNAELVLEVTDIGTAAGTWKLSYSTDVAIGTGTATTINFAAPTTTVVPVNIPVGADQTSPVSGDFTRDANGVFTLTNAAGHNGIAGADQYAVIATDFTLSAASGVQSAFPTTHDVWTLEGSTLYEVEGEFIMTTGTTTKTTALAFALGGGASVTYVNLSVIGYNAVPNTTGTAQGSVPMRQVASTIVTATATTAGVTIQFRGTIAMNAAGTVTPQINFSANPGGTNLMKAGSKIRFRKLGSSSFTKKGSVG